MTETCDKNRRPIRVGDVLKVFHFTAALRRKKHYMYKQVICERPLGGHGGSEKVPYLVVSHLGLDDETYYLGKDEGLQSDYEIIQNPKCDFEDRPKVNLTETENA